jgi:hypothetical protein
LLMARLGTFSSIGSKLELILISGDHLKIC